MRFSNLPKDILLKTALELDVPDILSLCKSDEKINEILCKGENKWFWMKKLQKDFNIEYDLKTEESAKNIYFKINEDFDQVLNSIFEEYPDKLKYYLINSGYVKEFQDEISKFLGPYYGKNIDEEIYENLLYNYDENENVTVTEILKKYFFHGGSDRNYYPLEDIDSLLLETFQVKVGEESDLPSLPPLTFPTHLLPLPSAVSLPKIPSFR